MKRELMNQKKAYTAPDFEVFNFMIESVLAPSNTTTKPAPPELPEDDFRGMKVF